MAERAPGLNARRQKFVILFVKLGNAREAALQAGFSKNTAIHAYRALVAQPDVAAAISVAQASLLRKHAIEADWVLQETAHIARSRISDLMRTDGTMKPVAEWPEHLQAAVSSVKFYDDGSIREVKFWGKNEALDRLAKHLGLIGQFGDGAAATPQTPEQLERRQQLRAHFLSYLDEMALKAAPPPPVIEAKPQPLAAARSNGNGAGGNGHG